MQQGITWTNGDAYLCQNIATVGQNKFKSVADK